MLVIELRILFNSPRKIGKKSLIFMQKWDTGVYSNSMDANLL